MIGSRRADIMHDLIASLQHLRGRELLQPLIEEHFKNRIALVSSFGTEAVVLLHMVASIKPEIPVIFLDTGKLFFETDAYRSKLQTFLGLSDVRVVRPLESDLASYDPQGTLNHFDPDLCCHIRKSRPLAAALSGFSAWISGRKQYHGGDRSRLPTMEWVDGRLKIDPLAHFSVQEIDSYIALHELPRHPLSAAGYSSVGCVPCTAKNNDVADPRAGRWAGRSKTECGIHWSANGRLIRIAAPQPFDLGGC
jgi:phosphoadenosine phosphosulfate reductase